MMQSEKDRKKYRHDYYEKNKDKILAQTSNYQKNHRVEVNKWARRSMNKLADSRKQQVLDLLGHRCARCGFEDERALQIDHVNGNGKSDKKRYSSTSIYLKHILEVNGEGYQILCANCNWIKQHENGEYLKRKDD